MDYVLSCCSAADYSAEFFEERNISVIFFHYELDGVEYPDDMGKTISPEELFRRMDAGADTKTSQVSMGEYMDAFEKHLKAGKDIIHITLSSGISGTYNSACLARDELIEKYPERNIYIVDSYNASCGYGLLVEMLADKRDEGASIAELYQYAIKTRDKINAWFYSTDLKYYIRGGRVSKTAGVIGQMLNICPFLKINRSGLLIPVEKLRGKKKAMQEAFKAMLEKAEDGDDYSGKCAISHSLFQEEAEILAKMIEEHFPNLDGPVKIFPIGATIGSHTGPGTVALFFYGTERDE